MNINISIANQRNYYQIHNCYESANFVTSRREMRYTGINIIL